MTVGNARATRWVGMTGLCVVAAAFTTGSAVAQAPQAARSAPPFEPSRLPDGHPDLQGLWLKSTGGFQGLFIGSLDGTNFAARGGGARGGGGGGGARGGGAPRGGPPAGPSFEYTPEAAAEKLYRQQHGYEDPESRCHLPGVPRSLDQPGGLYPVQIIQDEKTVA
ncbi:MAG TPA: hypothetical protein VFJ95_09135, partial [Gammaproteobacteria bacterium]|nr:hypothetical protein [Gammaproteobacteria bacterium]